MLFIKSETLRKDSMVKIICCFYFLYIFDSRQRLGGKSSWDDQWEREYAEWLENEVTPEFLRQVDGVG